MIKVNELRIGNLVERAGGIVTRINGYSINGSEERRIPIPLTEEWLLRLGLREISTSKWKSSISDTSRTDKVYADNIFSFGDEEMVIEFDCILDYDETELRRVGLRNCRTGRTHDLKFVHELQNLYFALTGEELEIKETVTS